MRFAGVAHLKPGIPEFVQNKIQGPTFYRQIALHLNQAREIHSTGKVLYTESEVNFLNVLGVQIKKVAVDGGSKIHFQERRRVPS